MENDETLTDNQIDDIIFTVINNMNKKENEEEFTREGFNESKKSPDYLMVKFLVMETINLVCPDK